MKKVFITGINGFIGSNLASFLLKKDYVVSGMVRKTSNLDFINDLNVKLYYGDIISGEGLSEALKNIDTVFHVAALASDWGDYNIFYESNVIGTKNVILAMIKENIKKIVYISSAAVYGFKDFVDGNENLMYDTKTRFHYIKTKIEAELLLKKLCTENNITYTIIRPGNVYGINDRITFLKLAEALEIRMFGYIEKGEKYTCPTYVENLTYAIWLSDNNINANNQDFIITDQKKITWFQYTKLFVDYMKVKTPFIKISYNFGIVIGTILEFIYKLLKIKYPPLITRYRIENAGKNYHFSTEKAERLLGYKPPFSTQEGVKKTVDWYYQNYKTNLKK